jgi:ABC-type antimicrobial peptide transport system permease subunit
MPLMRERGGGGPGELVRPAAGGAMLRVGWLVLRAELRARLRAWLALALVVGVAGGVVLTAAAGAQRTGTAFTRMLQASHAADVAVVVNASGQSAQSYEGYDKALARLPGVAGEARVLLGEVGNLALVLPGGVRVSSIGADVSVDRGFGTSVDRFKVLAGRGYRPGSADEVVVDSQLAVGYGLRPGSVLRLLMAPKGPGDTADFGRAILLRFRVAGVVVFDNQIVPVTPLDHLPLLELTPAFYRSREGGSFPVANEEALVRLQPGTNVAEFARQATRLARHYPATQGVQVLDLADQQAKVEQAIQPQADALALFAALAGLAVLVVIGQLLGRQLITGASDYPVLSALGTDRRQLFWLAIARAGIVSAAGGCAAVVIAVAASPLMPIGPARLAEPDPGVQVNLVILGIGLVAVAALPVLAIAPVAWRAAATASRRGTGAPVPAARPRLAAALAGLGGVPTAAIGVRMAFDPGRGRSAVPVRSALAGTAVAVAAVAAALVFGASLVQLVDTPRLYGQDWTLGLSLGFGSAPASGPSGVASFLSRVPGVAAYAGGNSGDISIDGQQVAAIAIQPLHGNVFPTLLDGAPPAGRRQIVLGARTLRLLGKHVGDLVSVQATPGAPPAEMRVVGEAIFPSFAAGSYTPTGLGDGAAVFSPVLPPSPIGCPRDAVCYGFFLIRFRPETPVRVISALGSRFVSELTADGCPAGTCQALTAAQPAAISNYSRVRATPLALAALLALLAVALIAHALLGTIRRRRRDFAVLKTLGFLRWQVSAAVAWEATALTATALLVGLPLGLAGGRWAWALFAGSVGISSSATVPLGAVLLTIPTALILANTIAASPGWAAARIKPAITLRNQ